MTDKPFFSLVIPVYNKELYIARAIISVLNKKLQDLEALIVCDSMPNAKDHLKLGIRFEILDKLTYWINDNQATDRLQKARQKLFKTIHGRTLKTG